MEEKGEEEKEEEEKEEEEEKGSTWGCLARPDGTRSSAPKKKGPPGREYPDPPFTLRKMTGSTGRTSYELSQRVTLCATPGKRVRMGTKWEGVERQRCTVSTRLHFGTGHLTRKPSTPGRISGKNTHPGGKSRKSGGLGGGGAKKLSPRG